MKGMKGRRNFWNFLKKIFYVGKHQSMITGSTTMYSSAPIEIPFEIGAVISEVVNKFCTKHDIKAYSWYHNESIWLLRKQEEDIVRTVEISLFDLDDGANLHGTYLCLIPNIFQIQIKPDQKIRTKTSIPLDLIKRLHWSELKESLLKKPPGTDALIEALGQTWSIAEKLDLGEKDNLEFVIAKGYIKT